MINLYYHGGSANHGCEAIVRSTNKILHELTQKPLTLFSTNIAEEERYGIDQIANVVEDIYKPVNKTSVAYIKCALHSKLYKSDFQFIKYGHKKFFDMISKNDIYLSIGGDNYCYAGTDKLSFYNRMIHDKGAKTVLWGCSIDPDVLSEKVVEDLKSYDLITVRESLSFEGLQRAGIKNNVLLYPDPAFQLESGAYTLPERFDCENVIGINVSPLVNECGNLVMDNYEELIRYILNYTDYKILLIPHVVKPESDDRTVLKIFLDKFASSRRIMMVDDCNCMELKSIISHCRMFIGARTHATIAAYSTYVPTLVAGYSIKARGIAKDIFGTDEHYVIPVQSFRDSMDLVNAFKWLIDHEISIRDFLKRTMPEYCAKAMEAQNAIKRIM